MDYLPFFSLETWILLIAFICLFVKYGTWTYGVFEKLGIPSPKPVMYWGTVGKQNPVYYLADIECAQKYGRIWGIYEFRMPMLAVMEPDMLKAILVKECFTYFTNRRDPFVLSIGPFMELFNDKVKPEMIKSSVSDIQHYLQHRYHHNLRLNGELHDAVSIAEDDQWRRIRNILSPSFTSGRIKEMFSAMKHCSRKLTACLQSKAHNDEVITMKDFFGAYSLDVMMSCAFSVDMDTINNTSSPLIAIASEVFRFSIPLFIFQACFPIVLPLLELLGVSFFRKTSTDFFKRVFEKVRAERSSSSHQNMGDILQNLINSQTTTEPKNQKQNKGLTDHEVFSQATVLVFAAYETSATTLVFLAYCLARNPEIMKRLQEEIDSTFPNKGPVHYEALMQMEYLDSVVSECLRLYPPVARLDRRAKETVTIKGITIPKDMLVMIPVYALHHDPELWPEPEEFKPDRFSKQNKQSIKPYTYLPFGVGPRNCIGMRFALVMIKLALVEVLQNFSFSVCAQTEIPLKMDVQGLVGPLNPIKLKLKTR